MTATFTDLAEQASGSVILRYGDTTVLVTAVMGKKEKVVAIVLSIDAEDPDTLGVIGASIALATSDIPWGGPVSAIRIGKKKGSDA